MNIVQILNDAGYETVEGAENVRRMISECAGAPGFHCVLDTESFLTDLNVLAAQIVRRPQNERVPIVGWRFPCSFPVPPSVTP